MTVTFYKCGSCELLFSLVLDAPSEFLSAKRCPYCGSELIKKVTDYGEGKKPRRIQTRVGDTSDFIVMRGELDEK